MKLPPDLAARCLALAGIPADPPKAKKLLAREMVAPAWGGKREPGTFWVPLHTSSESNVRGWKGRSARTQAARRALSRVLGPHLRALVPFSEWYHGGGRLRVVFTRLGGLRLDRGNLPSALKGTEDYLALVLGADDGDPRWDAHWNQEPTGKVGVRIELTTVARRD